MALTEQSPRTQEVRQGTTPEIDTVSQDALIELLAALPTPITITAHTDEQVGHYYTYQVGKTSEENPVGICMGAQQHFLDAVSFSLQAALVPRQPPVPRRPASNA